MKFMDRYPQMSAGEKGKVDLVYNSLICFAFQEMNAEDMHQAEDIVWEEMQFWNHSLVEEHVKLLARGHKFRLEIRESGRAVIRLTPRPE